MKQQIIVVMDERFRWVTTVEQLAEALVAEGWCIADEFVFGAGLIRKPNKERAYWELCRAVKELRVDEETHDALKDAVLHGAENFVWEASYGLWAAPKVLLEKMREIA